MYKTVGVKGGEFLVRIAHMPSRHTPIQPSYIHVICLKMSHLRKLCKISLIAKMFVSLQYNWSRGIS